MAHHWGKAARHSSREPSPDTGGMSLAKEEDSSGSKEHGVMDMDTDDEDTLEIRPVSTAVRVPNVGGSGDLSSGGHRRRRDKDHGSDSNRARRSRSRGESRFSDKRLSTADQQQNRRGDDSHSSLRRHRDEKSSSSRHQTQPSGGGSGSSSSKRNREEGEESSDDTGRNVPGRHITNINIKVGSSGSGSSPSVAPSSVADAVAADSTGIGSGPAQERAMRERLEKIRIEKLARERELQEELRKLGQDIMSPAQKAKMAQTKEKLQTGSSSSSKDVASSKTPGSGSETGVANTVTNSNDKKPNETGSGQEKGDKLKLPSRGISAFVEEADISSPESAEEHAPEPAVPVKKQKTYEYSKFGDLDSSSESEAALSPRRSPSQRDSPAAVGAAQTGTMTAMQRYLSERLDSSSRDGMSPAAIARAAAELRNSPVSGSPLVAGGAGGGDIAPNTGGAFASATFNDLFTDKPYEDSPKHIPSEIANLPPYFPALSGCRSVEEFECMNRIDEGTYGVVYRAKEKKTNEMVALKRLKMEKEREGFPITSLREIVTLLKAQHPNIVTVREIVVGSNMDKIYIVMDFVEHDLKALMESMKSPFLPGEVKTLMIQLLRGVAHMHDNWIIHRDLKTSNLLLSHRGVLKIGDFGLAREYGSPLKPYTQVVVTLWYRSAELLLGTKLYSTAVDMWSVGCIFAEMLNKKPLFNGRTEMEQLNRIFQVLGTPNEKIWPSLGSLPGWKKAAFADQPYNSLRNKFESGVLSDKGFNLINALLTYNPERRVSATDALKHPYFAEQPLPVPPSMFPTWPAKSEGGHRPKKVKKVETPRPPEAGVGAYAKLLGEDDDEERFKLNVAQGPSLFQIKP